MGLKKCGIYIIDYQLTRTGDCSEGDADRDADARRRRRFDTSVSIYRVGARDLCCG